LAQGQFIGLDEPCIPTLPIIDYGTSLTDAITALEAYITARKMETRFVQDAVSRSLATFRFIWASSDEQGQLEFRRRYAHPFFDSRQADNTKDFSTRVLAVLKKRESDLFTKDEQCAEG